MHEAAYQVSENSGFFSSIMMGFVTLNRRKKCVWGGMFVWKEHQMQPNHTKVKEKLLVVGKQCISEENKAFLKAF